MQHFITRTCVLDSIDSKDSDVQCLKVLPYLKANSTKIWKITIVREKKSHYFYSLQTPTTRELSSTELFKDRYKKFGIPGQKKFSENPKFFGSHPEQESPAIADKPARRESLPKIAPIRRASTLSLTILAYLHAFSCCCVRNLRNPEKFTENSNL